MSTAYVHTNTNTHIYVYISICVCVCICCYCHFCGVLGAYMSAHRIWSLTSRLRRILWGRLAILVCQDCFFEMWYFPKVPAIPMVSHPSPPRFFLTFVMSLLLLLNIWWKRLASSSYEYQICNSLYFAQILRHWTPHAYCTIMADIVK